MSADNYIAIQKRDGKYYVWMDFMSNDNPVPNENARSFDDFDKALTYAQGWEHGEMIVEYGIQTLNAYRTPIKTMGRNPYWRENQYINDAADQIRKNIEGCALYGIPIDMNNVNHLIVAAHESGFMKNLEENKLIIPKSGIKISK